MKNIQIHVLRNIYFTHKNYDYKITSPLLSMKPVPCKRTLQYGVKMQ